MKRLTELPANDRLTSRAHTLIRALGPTVESDERLLRVRRSLDTPVRIAAPRWGWRVGLALGLLGVSAAAASSSTVSRVLGLDEAAASGSHPLQPAPPSQTRPAQRTPTVAPVAPPAEAVVELVQPRPSAPTATPANVPTPRVLPPPLSDVARVHEAAKALRHDRNADRALQLLERGGTPVSGPLAEEALALRIEASMARGDGRQGKLATAYLAQYPQGRYRELAKKALAGNKQ